MHEPRCGRCGHEYSAHAPVHPDAPQACFATTWNEAARSPGYCPCAGWLPHPSGMDPHPRGRAVDPVESTYVGESELE